MVKKPFVQEAMTETESMEGATLALESTIAWPVTGDEFARELRCVLFMSESFQRHMDRLFALEELDGYMDAVRKLRPEFTNKINDLKKTHKQMRQGIRLLILDLKGTLPTEFETYHGICARLQKLIRWFRQHNLHESELFLEALFRETGGEA